MISLETISKTITGNLHQSYLYRVLSELYEQDSLSIREELGIESYSEIIDNPEELFERVRRHLLSKAFQDDETVKFLMEIPQWVGYKVDSDQIDTSEQVIRAAKQSSLAMIWVMFLPRVVIGHIVLPEDYEKQGVNIMVESLLRSDGTRKLLDDTVTMELNRRGFGPDFFNISNIIQGYRIDEGKRIERLRALYALVIMKATDCPFDLDRVFTLDEGSLIDETEAYIITMHTMNSLSSRIKGSGSIKPFDWPLIGTTRVLAGIMTTLVVMRKYSSIMSTCSLFKTTSKGITTPWSESEFISYLLKEIADYYIDSLRTRLGRNEELERFVDILKGENLEITSRIMESSDKGESLYEELAECKRRARIGESAQISPERRLRVVLSNLKQSLDESQADIVSSEDIVDQIAQAFDAIFEVIRKHQDSLGNEIDKFTEELCFETSFRILDLLGIGWYLPDLPWISRFIAEESTMIDISSGELSELHEGQRVKRIVYAFAGGVSFLVLQAR